ncbi:alpha/beta-hydrolase [Mycena filopes]|nr:alpha/beta-hydrolase [Mycena filopes]
MGEILGPKGCSRQAVTKWRAPYFSAPATGKPVLLFAHGFPIHSIFWHKQVAFFEPLGYGLLVPDLLGYGGTDKPTDPKLYAGSGLAHDFADILDAEGVERVIGIGHDCPFNQLPPPPGLRLRLPRILAVGYFPPVQPGTDIITRSDHAAEIFGYDAFGYLRFFTEPDTAALIAEHIDSFFSLFFPEGGHTLDSYLFVDGGARARLEGDRMMPGPLPAYMTPETTTRLKTSLLTGGLAGPLCWCKVQVNAKIPASAHDVTVPLLYIALTRDRISPPILAETSHDRFAKGPVTAREVGCGHWGGLEQAEEVSGTILEWVEGLDGEDTTD